MSLNLIWPKTQIGNADAVCRRQDQLWEMAKTSDELQTYINSPAVSSLLANLTAHCGETVDVDNLWIIADAYLIEVAVSKEKLTFRIEEPVAKRLLY